MEANESLKRELNSSDEEGSSCYEDSGSNTPKYKRKKLEKGSDEYTKRRERNNIAVKKSREKSKVKAMQTLDQVEKLRKENEHLEQKVTILSKELGVLKDLFLAHAGTTSQGECSNSSPQPMKSEIKDHEYSSAC